MAPAHRLSHCSETPAGPSQLRLGSAFPMPGGRAFLGVVHGNPTMLDVRSFENAASLIRSFGGQVVMSLAVSAAVAGILAVSQLWLGPGHAPLPVPEARIDKA
jgi:hypothetical protein